MTIQLNDHDSHIHIGIVNNNDVVDHVAPLVYTFRNTLTGPILVKDRKRFEVATRKFGKHAQYLAQITADYDRLGPARGVLLEGIKGAGKSMLSEDICNWAINLGLPVVRVDQALDEADLRLIIAACKGACVLYFDEFGKVYEEEARNKLLSFFADQSIMGVYFLLTANSTNELSNFMVNRPGRFQFRIVYSGLEVEDAMEVAKSFNLNEEMTKVLCRFTAYHFEISYDILIHVARLMLEVKSFDELLTKIESMNVPPVIYNYYEVKTIKYGDEVYGTDRATVTIKDDVMFLTLRDEADEILLDTLQIDLFDERARWTDTDVDYPTGLKVGDYRLVLKDHGLIIEFRRTLAEKVNRMKLSLQRRTSKKEETEEVEAS